MSGRIYREVLIDSRGRQYVQTAYNWIQIPVGGMWDATTDTDADDGNPVCFLTGIRHAHIDRHEGAYGILTEGIMECQSYGDLACDEGVLKACVREAASRYPHIAADGCKLIGLWDITDNSFQPENALAQFTTAVSYVENTILELE